MFISLFVLRFNDPFTPRPYMMPLNIQIRYKGRQVWFPLLGMLGFLGVLFFLVMVLLTHQYARIVGPIWVLGAVALFAIYRRKCGLPMFKTLDRDWVTATRRVLLDAEEYKSLAGVRRGARGAPCPDGRRPSFGTGRRTAAPAGDYLEAASRWRTIS